MLKYLDFSLEDISEMLKKEEPGEPKQVQVGHISLQNIVLHARMPKEQKALNEGISIILKDINVFQQKGEAEIKDIIITNPSGYFEENQGMVRV